MPLGRELTEQVDHQGQSQTVDFIDRVRFNPDDQKTLNSHSYYSLLTIYLLSL